MPRKLSQAVRSIAITSILMAQSASVVAQAPLHAPEVRKSEQVPLPSPDVPDGFTVVATGDLICAFPVSNYISRYSKPLASVLGNADVTFGNFEISAFDLASFEGYPQAESGGSWLLATPEVPKDLRSLGFNLVSRANNHATDYGVEGMRATERLLDEAGIAHAGTGETLSAARAPGYIFTKSQRRVALVSVATTVTPMSVASDPLGRMPGRPGASAIGLSRAIAVSENQLQRVRELGKELPTNPPPAEPISVNSAILSGTTYRLAPDRRPGDFIYDMNSRDLRDVLLNIRQGKQSSDLELVSVHAHEPGNADPRPANFVPELAHAAVDAGADIFIGHGPHQLRGIEIYKGRPIFYSLGNFCHMYDAPQPQAVYDRLGVAPGTATTTELMYTWRQRLLDNPNFLESVVAVTRFDGGKAKSITLYPIQLSGNGRVGRIGEPALANGEQASRILERLQSLSRPFGTTIKIRGGLGYIDIATPQ